MAVERAGKWWEGRSGRFGSSLQQAFTDIWKVKTTVASDSAVVVRDYFRDTLNIAFGAAHPDATGFPTPTVRSVDPSPIAANGWMVAVQYSTAPFSSNQQDEEEPDPLSRRTRIWATPEFYQEFTTRDKDGKPMLTTAGYPMEPIEVDRVGRLIHFSKNFTTEPSWVSDFENTVNSAPFVVNGETLAARTCKMNGIDVSDELVENGVVYKQVGGSFSFRKVTWDLERLNAGFYDKDGSRIQDDDGNDCVEPWPLDSSGDRIDVKTARANNTIQDVIIFNTEKHYQERDFNLLPL